MTRAHPITKQGSQRGFTLIELLVSAAILAIVIAILLGILSASLNTWRSTQGKIEVDTEGRSGALLLLQDISSIILPSNPKLWPEVMTNSQEPYFRFLSLKPTDYQGTEDPSKPNVGDVCYVEYFFSKENNTLMRRFYPSRYTFDNIIKAGSFPAPSQENAEILSTNLLTELKDSVRGSNLYGEAGKRGFVLLCTNNWGMSGTLMPYSGATAISNPPVGVEINFAATDISSAQNPQLLTIDSYKLKNAGYFSIRLDFPKPQ